MLNNAIQYNQTGKTIGIQVTNLGIEFQIVIWDDGTSIQSKSGESIFDPFVRGDRARSSSGGTGLGLSIVKAIIEKHHGTVKYSYSEMKNQFIICCPKE